MGKKGLHFSFFMFTFSSYVHGFYKHIKQVKRKKFLIKLSKTSNWILSEIPPICHNFLDFVGDIKVDKILSQLFWKISKVELICK